METDAVLETGCGPDTPGGDNLCNDYARGLSEAFGSLAAARGDRVEYRPALGLMMSDRSSRSAFANAAVLTRPLDGDGWRDAAAILHEFYGAAPGGPFLVFSAWPTPDLADAGFGRVGHPPLMLRPPGPVDGPASDGLALREVGDRAGAETWERLVVDGYPEPDLQPFTPGCLLPEAALGVPRWRRWVAELDGVPVGAGAAWVGDHHVDVEFIATMPEARGRGVGRALTAVALAADPALPALLIASDLGRSVYERLGFRAVLRLTLWSGHRRAAGP